ncbi:hypothetical protein MA16_Dca001781 [Dendrobium catenatum]|uniref:Uncharacterized protein n=1 Tax=Dendrobium catenatum TaxID=906689 RepID=A0A2I0XDH5_9ASPA|nr:hypothetical protein MA16_Dca001781 [Dendrobium catenatum]
MLENGDCDAGDDNRCSIKTCGIAQLNYRPAASSLVGLLSPFFDQVLENSLNLSDGKLIEEFKKSKTGERIWRKWRIDLDGVVLMVIRETERAEINAVHTAKAMHVPLVFVSIGVELALNEEARREQRP